MTDPTPAEIHWSDGLWWVEQLGMLHAAAAIETPEPGDAQAEAND